jgi:hypothetical protein
LALFSILLEDMAFSTKILNCDIIPRMNETTSDGKQNFRAPAESQILAEVAKRPDGLVRAMNVKPNTPVEIRYRNRKGPSPMVTIREIGPTRQSGNPQVIAEGRIPLIGGGTFVRPLQKLS